MNLYMFSGFEQLMFRLWFCGLQQYISFYINYIILKQHPISIIFREDSQEEGRVPQNDGTIQLQYLYS
jgi:hypothetical protein